MTILLENMFLTLKMAMGKINVVVSTVLVCQIIAVLAPMASNAVAVTIRILPTAVRLSQEQ